MTACGVQPVAPGWQRLDHFDLFGAVAPTPGDSCLLALPLLHSAMCQLWLDDFAPTLATSFNMLVLDKGAFHTATGRRGPAHVAAVPLPPYRPDLTPSERLWRDLKEQLAGPMSKTLDA
jgi:hypothetical protein